MMNSIENEYFLKLCAREEHAKNRFESGNGSQLRRLRLANLYTGLHKRTTAIVLQNVTVFKN